MKECPQCKGTNADDARFCSGCGLALTKADPSTPPPVPEEPAKRGPIRVVLPAATPKPPEPPPEPPKQETEEDKKEGVPAGTAILLGVLVFLSLVFTTIPTLVFLLLGFSLFFLYRQLAEPEMPMEEYARRFIQCVESGAAHVRNPDGRVILWFFMAAVLLVLLREVFFGLIGAAAVTLSLFLLTKLETHLNDFLGWLDHQEPGWAGGLKRGFGKPVLANRLAVVASIPVAWYLVFVFLHPQTGNFGGKPFIREGIVVLATLVFTSLIWFLGTLAGGSIKDRDARLDRQTFFISMLVLTLSLCCTGIQMADSLSLSFFSKEWNIGRYFNGVWLAVFPVLMLWLWYRSCLGRASREDMATLRLSSFAALIVMVSGFLMWRPLELEIGAVRTYAGRSVFAVMVVVWFFMARLLIRMTAREGGQVPEWVLVYLAVMVCMILGFFLVCSCGLPGLVCAVLAMVQVWRAAAKIMRRWHGKASPSENLNQ